MMETSNDKSYEDLLQKISNLQKQVETESKYRQKSINEPKSGFLQDLSKRYTEETGSDFEKSFKNLSTDVNTREKFSNVFKSNDSKFLDDFFGVRKFVPSKEERKRVEEMEFADFKHSMTSRFEKSVSESILQRFCCWNRKETYGQEDLEWMDFKSSFNQNYFRHRNDPSVLWDESSERIAEANLKNILEFLHSKVRLVNFESISSSFTTYISNNISINNNINNNISNNSSISQLKSQYFIQTHLKNFLDFQSLELPSSQKNILRAAVEVIQFLNSNNLSIINKNTIDYDSKLIEFGLKYFARNFQEFLASFTPKLNYNFQPLSKNDFLYSYFKDTNSNLKNIAAFYAVNSRINILSVNDIPKWFILYNLIRTADYELAIKIIGNLAPNYHILMVPLRCLKDGCEIAFKNDEMDDLQNLARLNFNNSDDPYEKLIVGLLTFSQIDTSLLRPLETVEEFAWFKLLRLKLSMMLSSKTFKNPLMMIQEELENDFENQESKNTASSSLIFSQSTCLFIVGDFEKGIENLNRDKIGLVYAIHLAILFFNANLLNATIMNHKPLVLVEEGEIRSIKINVGQLLTYFFHNFYHILEIFIIDYFIAFKNLEGGSYEIFSLASKLLIDKFSNFDQNLMLQWLDSEGVKPFSPQYSECANSLAEYCSSINEDSISLSLYSKIDKLDKIVTCMTELLTQLISSPNAFSPETIDKLEKFANEIGDRVLVDKNLDNNESSYFLLLLDLTLFFKDIRNNRYASALKIANQLQLVPCNYSQIQKCLEKISIYPRKFRLIYRHILLSVVTSIQKIYEISKYETGKIGIQEVNILREQASALLSFTSQLPFPMSKTTRTKILSALADLRKQL